MRALLARIATEFWNLDARAMQGLERLVLRSIEGETVTAEAMITAIGCGPSMAVDAPAGGKSPGYLRAGSVALVPVWGVLDRTDADVTDEDGVAIGTSYDAIARGVFAARADDQVGVILQVHNSPGGAARPMEEYAARLFADAEVARASGGKPTVAVAVDLMASASFGLAAQADEVVSLPGAWIGSIGTKVSLFDFSSYLDRLGIKVNAFTTGPFKNMGSPFHAMTEEQKAKMQEMVHTYGAQFRAGVARGRRMTAEEVQAIATGEGWVGAAAVAKGLADRLASSLPELVIELNSKYPAKASGGSVAPRANAITAAPEPAAAALPHRGASAKERRMSTRNLIAAAGLLAAAGATSAAGTTPPGADSTGNVADSTAPPPSKIVPGADTSASPPGATLSMQDITNAATKAAVDAVAAERKRVADISAAALPYSSMPEVRKLADEAVNGTDSADVFKGKLLSIIQKTDPPRGGLNFSVGTTSAEKQRKGIEVVLLARMNPMLMQSMQDGHEDRPGLTARLASELGFASPAAVVAAYQEAEANGYRRPKLIDFCEQLVCMGNPGRQFNFRTHDDVLSAAFGMGSSDLPKLLSGLAQKTLMLSFELEETTFDDWCFVGSSPDFKSEDMITLSETEDLEELPEGAKPTEAKIAERAESMKQKTHAKAFSITRQAIINDDLSGISRTLQGWGSSAARKAEDLAWGQVTGNPVMADGNQLFSVAHANTISGASTVLSMTGVEQGMTKMMTQKGFGASAPQLDIMPRILAVPTNLWAEAARITGADFDQTAATASVGASPSRINVIKGKLKVVVSSRLFKASQLKWYLFGDPRRYPVVVVKFLNGQRRPIVNPVGDGSILGQRFEVVHDVSAKALQWEAGVESAGQ